MARSANQKLKLLYLCRILMEQTDEEHPLSVQELIAQLARYGIQATIRSRRSVPEGTLPGLVCGQPGL